MHIEVGDEWTTFVEELVRGGRFSSPREVVEAALDALLRNETFEPSSDQFESAFPRIHEKVHRGLQDARAGRLIDGDEFFDQLDRDNP